MNEMNGSSNGDKIRSLNDEGLARFIVNLQIGMMEAILGELPNKAEVVERAVVTQTNILRSEAQYELEIY